MVTSIAPRHRPMLAEILARTPEFTVDEVAEWSGTIGYEVLTSLGRRYRRVWTR